MSQDNNDYDQYLSPMYTDAQTGVLELLPYTTAPFSVIGASLILRYIWCNRKTHLKLVFHRLILCISLLDLITSLNAIILGPWVVPAEVGFTLFGRGTFRTCAVSGFFMNFVFGTMWYSSFLSLYFLLAVFFERKERCMACFFEPIAHLLCFVISVMIGIHGVLDDALNPMRQLPGFCWFQDYPPYCSTMENAPDCIRGENYSEYSGKGSAGTVLFLLVIIVISMTLIVIKVRRTEVRLRQYAIGESVRDLRRTKETANQAILYIASFFVVYFPFMMMQIVGDYPDKPNENVGALFAFAFLTKAFTPLQGAFNAYIYLGKHFWKNTREKQCFGFLRKIPLLGNRISRLSDQQNFNSRHRISTTGATARSELHEEAMPSSVVQPSMTSSSFMAQKEVLPQNEQSKITNQIEIVSHLAENSVDVIRPMKMSESQEESPVPQPKGELLARNEALNTLEILEI